MYDSILIGNGFTLTALNKVHSISSHEYKNYLFCKFFINDFINAKPHQKILRNFNRLFENYEKTATI
jgi:hypothetical protein